MQLVDYNPEWQKMFEQEKKLIESVLYSEELIDIQHIGSTAIKTIKSKPIVDIAVLVTPDEYTQSYVRPLTQIGYTLYPESSSSERLFFRKGDPVKFHLSLTQEGKTPYYERQILFRDYLNAHPDLVKEYETLKLGLFSLNPDDEKIYTDGKFSFISKILTLAKK